LDIRFHHGDMFVSGCVENDFWSEIKEQLANPIGITDVGYAVNATNAMLVFKQAQAKEIQPGFALVEADELRWGVVENLPAEFGANGASGAGNQHASPPKWAANCFEVDFDAFAAEQIIEADFPQLTDRHFPGDDVLEGGHGAEADSRAIAGFN